MTTAQTLITDAFIEARVADVVDGPTSNESTFGLRQLNRMIALWSTENVFIPYSTSENFSTVSGTASYTMGSGGTASSARARKITDCYARDSAGLDWPVDIVSEKDYNAIADKDIGARPRKLFYDPVYDTGVIYFYPVPDAVYTVYIESHKDLHAALSLGTTVSLPTEYEELIVSNLAMRIGKTFGSPNMNDLVQHASHTRRKIVKANAPRFLKRLSLPFSRVGGRYDINSDERH